MHRVTCRCFGANCGRVADDHPSHHRTVFGTNRSLRGFGLCGPNIDALGLLVAIRFGTAPLKTLRTVDVGAVFFYHEGNIMTTELVHIDDINRCDVIRFENDPEPHIVCWLFWVAGELITQRIQCGTIITHPMRDLNHGIERVQCGYKTQQLKESLEI